MRQLMVTLLLFSCAHSALQAKDEAKLRIFKSDLKYELKVPTSWSVVAGPGVIETRDPIKSDMVDFLSSKEKDSIFIEDENTFRTDGVSVIVAKFETKKSKLESIASSGRAMQSATKPLFFKIDKDSEKTTFLEVTKISKGNYRWSKRIYCGMSMFVIEITPTVDKFEPLEEKLKSEFYLPSLLKAIFDSFNCK